MSKINIPAMALLIGLTSSLLAASATATLAQQTKKAPVVKKTAATAPAAQYECQKCHMRSSAAVAKKNHFLDPMDGGKLMLVKTAAASTQKTATASLKPTK